MTAPPTIDGLIAYVRSKQRPNQIDARLVAEIDRLMEWIAAMSAEHPKMARDALAGKNAPIQEAANV